VACAPHKDVGGGDAAAAVLSNFDTLQAAWSSASSSRASLLIQDRSLNMRAAASVATSFMGTSANEG